MNLKLPWKKDKLTFPIVRVDDRLFHGQVIVGWGQSLGISPLVLASDRILKEPAMMRTMKELVPEEQNGDVLSIEEVAQRWAKGDYKESKAMIVVEAPVDALKLIKSGAPMKQLILGGLHYREDRHEILPYIYLSDWDYTTLAEIMKEGVKIVCQDLPTTAPVPFKE